MKTLMKSIVICVAAFGCVMTLKQFSEEQKNRQNAVYSLLEKDFLTTEEKEYVDGNTSGIDDTFITLDEEHRKHFRRHFGYER